MPQPQLSGIFRRVREGGKLLLLNGGKRACENMFALPENQIAREDSRELSGARGIHLVAHNHASRGGATCAGILVEWPDDDLVEVRVVDPPIQRGFLRMMAGIRRPQQVTD